MDECCGPRRAEPAVACTLGEPELRARRAELEAAFAGAITGVEELADGYRLRLTSRDGLLATVAHFIELERACCPFLTFTLTAPADGGEITLAMTGAPAAKDFLRAAMTTWQDRGAPAR